MHLLSNRVMLQELLNAGILQGNVDDMMKVFQPLLPIDLMNG